MRLTKFGHACVRLEHDGARIVVDPGVISEREALDGATAVLITHEHPDHWTPANLRATDAPVITTRAVAEAIRAQAPDLVERVRVVSPGERTDVGVPVEVVGERHAVIHPELPRVDNSGYLLTLGDVRVFHPGDALTVPDTRPDVLMLPVCAPWMKMSESIDYARVVAAPRNVAIHDGVYSEFGLGIVDAHQHRFLDPLGLEYRRLASGADL